ncbi:NADH-quinone oxidoreductase subunit I, partial [Streptomyces sp. NPDC002172]
MRGRRSGAGAWGRAAQFPAPLKGRSRWRPALRGAGVLDRFAIDFSLCMYCGICIEVCPFDALFWSP